MLARRRRGPRRRGGSGRAPSRRWRSPSRCSPATTTPAPTSSPTGSAVAVEAGCGGLVCAAADLRRGPRRWRPRCCGSCRASGPPAAPTPRPGPRRRRRPEALAAGADLLVIGRAVTQADDPAAAAAEVAAAVGRVTLRTIRSRGTPREGADMASPPSLTQRHSATPPSRRPARPGAARAELKEKLKMGSVTLAEVLERGRRRRRRSAR